jgi:hypothetical protein
MFIILDGRHGQRFVGSEVDMRIVQCCQVIVHVAFSLI